MYNNTCAIDHVYVGGLNAWKARLFGGSLPLVCVGALYASLCAGAFRRDFV